MDRAIYEVAIERFTYTGECIPPGLLEVFAWMPEQGYDDGLSIPLVACWDEKAVFYLTENY